MNVNFTKINNECNFYELFYKNKMWTRKVRFAQITKRRLRKNQILLVRPLRINKRLRPQKKDLKKLKLKLSNLP